jgi:hypothetical protein
MISMWAFFLIAGMAPELKTVPFTTSTHIAPEMTAGIVMLIGEILLLKKIVTSERIALLGLGMFMYAVIQAPGY